MLSVPAYCQYCTERINSLILHLSLAILFDPPPHVPSDLCNSTSIISQHWSELAFIIMRKSKKTRPVSFLGSQNALSSPLVLNSARNSDVRKKNKNKNKRPPHSWVVAVASFFTASKAKTPPPAYEISFCAMEIQPLAIRSSPSSGLFDTVAVNPVRLVLIHHYVHPSAPPEYVSSPIIVRVCCTVVHTLSC
ncbi:hypothetical protein ASPFODRAFT_528784 [Aspergillus luchuensis CBS 106.47]|uniref:Uncharacterized protein n=1 Tax=Aspergillus luchuensis (strain CBS 106.47) TaxID=1137211 RepID=A0A1M3TN78_ASPLC|nr:hypothetical protein ASPFODRAFT_528784 [Aspergillus luchuensis CBS 106.47]